MKLYRIVITFISVEYKICSEVFTIQCVPEKAEPGRSVIFLSESKQFMKY